MQRYHFQRLLKNIKDAIHEGQVKLGYVDEIVRMYYMEPSLLHLLGVHQEGLKNLDEVLVEFELWCKEKDELINVSKDGKRFCFTVSRELSKKIYETYEDNGFLQQLAKTLQNRPCNIDDILNVFYSQSDKVICEKCEGMEFDYVISYEDPEIDEYKYCFTIDEMHAYYHRFTEFDYQSIL